MKLLVITQKVDKNDQLLGFFIQWLKLLSDKFDQLEVLCLEKEEYDLPSNVNVHSLGKDRGESKLKQLLNFNFLLLTLHYDAVLVHMNPIWMVLGVLFWKIMGSKTFLWYTSGGVTFKLKIAEKFADKIFTASSESFRLKSIKVIVTGHGIDTELFKPNPNKLSTTNYQLRILSVGRISPVKNYGILIEAVKILKDQSIDFKVTIIGETALDSDKHYLASLKLKVESLKLENEFNFVGKINHEDLPKYYQSHDIFAHLSKTGSLDKSFLEAMACGMKVLSSNDASKSFLPSELIFDDKNPKDLTDKILDLARNHRDYNLRQYVVENHNLSSLIAKLAEIMHQ